MTDVINPASMNIHLPTDPTDKKRWVVIYPTYINSQRTIPEGTRINKHTCIHTFTSYTVRRKANRKRKHTHTHTHTHTNKQ